MKKIILVITLLICFGLPSTSDAFRYGSKLIQEGEYTFEVFEKCGEPIHKELIQLGIKHPKIEHWVYEQNGWFYLLI